jgi:hypothetical protein
MYEWADIQLSLESGVRLEGNQIRCVLLGLIQIQGAPMEMLWFLGQPLWIRYSPTCKK